MCGGPSPGFSVTRAGAKLISPKSASSQAPAPARAGDVLTASAQEASQAGRTGVYDVQVRNQRNELIALFRGRSYRMQGKPAVPVAEAG